MNEFEKYLNECVGKTIDRYCITDDGDVKLIFTDNSTLTLGVDNDGDLYIDEITPKFTISYSSRRGEIYVYDKYDNFKFTIPEDQLPGEPRCMDKDSMVHLIKQCYQQELLDHNLL